MRKNVNTDSMQRDMDTCANLIRRKDSMELKDIARLEKGGTKVSENKGFGLAGALGMLPLQMAAARSLRAAEVERAGVVEIGGYDGKICVNQDNIVELIEDEVDKLMPIKDYNGKFAARVYIHVELLGDQDPKVFERMSQKNQEKKGEENHETVEDSADL